MIAERASMGRGNLLQRAVGPRGLSEADDGSMLSVQTGEAEAFSDASSTPGSPAARGKSVRQSSWQRTSMVVMGEVMGTGVLALPHACAYLGWVLGLGSVAVFACAGTYAGLLLSRSRDVHPEAPESYADLARLTGGPAFGAFTRVCICATWALILPYYLLSCVKAAEIAIAPLGGGAADLCQWHWTVAVALALLPALQLRSLHQVSLLALASTIAVAAAIVIVLCSLLLEPLEPLHAPQPHGPHATAAQSALPATTSLWPPVLGSPLQLYAHLGEVIYAFQGHSIYFELMREMKSPSEFPKALYASNSLMALAYLLTSSVGYAARGSRVAGFLPESMAPGAARAVVGALLAFHTAVAYLITALPLHRELVGAVRGMGASWTRAAPPEGPKEGTGLAGALRWFAVSLACLLFSILVANGIPFFSELQALLGSLAGAPILFGWPAFFYLRSCHMRSWRVARLDYLGCGVFLLVFVPVFCGLGTAHAIADIRTAWAHSDQEAPFTCAARL